MLIGTLNDLIIHVMVILFSNFVHHAIT